MIDWHSIDTVLLDMDGTLLDLHYDNHFWLTHLPERYASLHNINKDVAAQQLHEHITDIEGTLNWYCLDYWSALLQVDILEIKKETLHKVNTRPNAIEFLRFLRAQNKQVRLVTNAHPGGLAIKLEKTGIGDYFDEIISAHQLGFAKEAPVFWDSLQQHQPFDKDRTLFIDDNLHVLQTAKNHGIKYVVGIHQPDSKIPRTLDYAPAIRDFSELMRT